MTDQGIQLDPAASLAFLAGKSINLIDRGSSWSKSAQSLPEASHRSARQSRAVSRDGVRSWFKRRGIDPGTFDASSRSNWHGACS